MKKKFLFEERAKARVDCDKLSKSVSYETLVGGTTTSGREYEQAQCLSKGSAKTPLDAVGTFPAAHRAASKVVEKSLHRHSELQAKNPEKTKTVIPDLIGYFSRIKMEVAEILGSCSASPRMTMLWILHFASALFKMTTGRCSLKKIATSAFRLLAMTPSTLTLAAVLATGMLSESRAVTISCINGVREDGVTACEKCGDNCDWSISGDTLTITGSGAMTDYKSSSDSPWRKAGNFGQVKNLVIDGITRIGSHAFWGSKIKKITMSDTVTEIGAHSFAWSNFSEIKLSDNLEKLEESAFRRTHMPTIVLPADVLIGFDALGDFAPDIVCKGNAEDCKKLYNQLHAYSHNTPEPPYGNVPQDLSPKMQKIKQSQCESTNYYWSGSSCNNKKNGIICDENWKQVETWCNRIRYTPADAAEVLKDTDNELIMTFKVNR
ncbi:MAG: leucine-rich repeat domain-containing protein [Alphaproteobacteria bacterium]|nr:leucine-rich repeat domain-containing protein [Alphaproteobacteria bacterium]